MRRVSCGASGLRTSLARRPVRGTARAIASAIFASASLLAASLPAFAQTSAPAPVAVDAPPAAPARVSIWDAPEPWRTDRFYLETSVYTHHFNSDPNHDNSQKLILGEWNITEQWLVGASIFDNSFGQPSQYVYGGVRLRPFEGLQPLYFKLSAGIVHGYTGEYQNKIPFNNSGFAPVIVPSIGYCYIRYCSELVIFGGAGLLVTFGVTIP